MPDATDQGRDFDLRPDPRILPMLGEINLPQWRCLAELVDNSIDAFLHAREAGSPIVAPEVTITVPVTEAVTGKVVIRDNGPGMDPGTLERAVRAGWTGNDPIHNLGMFGMGFNIATARLGTLTSVWTTRAGDREYWGVVIDFDELRKQRHFRTPLRTRPKQDASISGTEVTIERLKPEQRQWLATTANRSRLVRELQRAYTAMLAKGGVPISFALQLNARALSPRPHCVWGNTADGSPQRIVPNPRLGPIDALQTIDVLLPDRPFCAECWQWIPAQETVCPACGRTEGVVVRKRRIHGWLGIQRYLSDSDFGIDFIRHGRKIEIGCTELFRWIGPDGQDEMEYPIDDPRWRGRIVGEIHVDHCRVTYMKDRFDRNDPAWDEMVQLVRGEGPLRPDKAQELGSPPNSSPLFKLFQAFRRTSPKPKSAGGYARLLIVPDADRAFEMAQRFYAGEVQYQSDAEWFKLAEEEDRKLLTGGAGPGGDIPGFGGGSPAPGPAPAPTPAPTPPPAPPPPPARDGIPSLTREYVDDTTAQRWNVHAFKGGPSDALLALGSLPWKLQRTPQGPWEFVVDPGHAIFRSMTMTPLDALLLELAHTASDFQRSVATPVAFARILASLRDRYGTPMKLDPQVHAADARESLVSIARSLRRAVQLGEGRVLFDNMSPSERDHIRTKMAQRSVPDPQKVIDQGGFLEFAPTTAILRFIQNHPEFFFDGKYWQDAYVSIDYGMPLATEEAKSRVLGRYLSLLSDAAWLADNDPAELGAASRPRLHRAALALDLLEPATDPEASA